jgi:hypothetical protein
MIANPSRRVDGNPSMGPRVPNPWTPTAGACSHARGTLHYPPAIFEAAKPGLPAGLRMIVLSAFGSPQTSRGLVNLRSLQRRVQARA